MNGINEALSWWDVGIFFIGVMFAAYLADRGHSKIMTFVTGMILVCVCGLRHGYIDTRAYRVGFENLELSNVFSLDFLINGESKDRGFSFLSGIIRYFTDNGQVFLFIMALITVLALYYGLINRVPNMTYAVFLFICTGCYLDTMNGLRQALASSLLFLILPNLIIEKKFIKYVLVIAILSTVHASALVFIPLYFIAIQKPWTRITGLFSVCVLLIFAFFNTGIGDILVEFLDGTSYGQDYSEMLLAGNTSVNVVRVFVSLVPVLLSFFYRNDKKNFPMYNIAFNFSLINAFTWIFATKVFYFYRLAMYFQPYMILLLCYEIFYLNKEPENKIFKVMSVLLFILWLIYSLHVMGDIFFVGYLKY